MWAPWLLGHSQCHVIGHQAYPTRKGEGGPAEAPVGGEAGALLPPWEWGLVGLRSLPKPQFPSVTPHQCLTQMSHTWHDMASFNLPKLCEGQAPSRVPGWAADALPLAPGRAAPCTWAVGVDLHTPQCVLFGKSTS